MREKPQFAQFKDIRTKMISPIFFIARKVIKDESNTNFRKDTPFHILSSLSEYKVLSDRLIVNILQGISRLYSK